MTDRIEHRSPLAYDVGRDAVAFADRVRQMCQRLRPSASSSGRRRGVNGHSGRSRRSPNCSTEPRGSCTVRDVAGWDPGDERLSVAAHQAAGMIAEQAHCDIRAAFDLLFSASVARGRSPSVTALDVVGHIIDFFGE